jgi:hypothetical protein
VKAGKISCLLEVSNAILAVDSRSSMMFAVNQRGIGVRKLRNIARYMTGLILALVAAAGPAFSPASNTWTAIGPSDSEYVNSLAIDPAELYR